MTSYNFCVYIYFNFGVQDEVYIWFLNGQGNAQFNFMFIITCEVGVDKATPLVYPPPCDVGWQMLQSLSTQFIS